MDIMLDLGLSCQVFAWWFRARDLFKGHVDQDDKQFRVEKIQMLGQVQESKIKNQNIGKRSYYL
jgi:hypothetical protein